MALLQSNVLIRAPLERVFAYTTDVSGVHAWLHPAEKISGLTGWPGAGARLQYRWRFLGLVGEGEGQVTEYQPDVRVAIATADTLGQAIWALDWTRRGVGCRLTLTTRYEGSPKLLTLGLDPLALQQLLHRHADLALNTLKALIERQGRHHRALPSDRSPLNVL